LTGLHPRPECCVDTDRYGTLVVHGDYTTGTNRSEFRKIDIDLDSVATLHYQDTHHPPPVVQDTDLWYPVSLWTSDTNHAMMHGAVDMVWLKQQLKDAWTKNKNIDIDDDNGGAPCHDEYDALRLFIRDARLLFHV
jgi:hypothetical protein